MLKKILAPLFIVALSSGCQTLQQQVKVDDAPKIESNALSELKKISVEARHELRLLAKAQEARNAGSLTAAQHQQRFFQATYVPEGFEQNVSFKFAGKATKALEAISLIAQYKIETYGQMSGIEPKVLIHIDDKPLNDALKELGMQTGDSMKVEVYPASRIIRAVYK